MATLAVIAESKILVVDAETTSAQDDRIMGAEGESPWTDGSCLTTPSRSPGLTVDGGITAALRQSNTYRSCKDSTNTANFESFRHNSPLMPSSSSTTSIASSPNQFSNVWDSPQIPGRAFTETSEAYGLTPTSPSMPLSPTGQQVFKILTTRRISHTGTISEKVEGSMGHASNQDAREDKLVKEEDFEPKKLVRGLTAELLTIAAANATAAQGKYTLWPTFDFSETIVLSMPTVAREKLKYHSKVSKTDQNRGPSSDNKPKTGVVLQNSLFQTTVRTLLENLVPHDLQVRLEENPLQCVASLIKNPQKRCGYKAKAPRFFDEGCPERFSRYIDSATLTEDVENMIRTVLCGSHKISTNKRWEKLQPLIASLGHTANEVSCSYDSENPKPSSVLSYEVSPKENKKTRTRGITHAATTSVTAQAVPTATVAINSTIPVPPLTSSYSLEFLPYRPKKWNGVSVPDALYKIITQPLSATDLKLGFIYVFWDVKHFGMVKIGRTNDLEKRLQKWDKDCKRKHKYHTKLPMIPHVSRVERLIHMELKQERKSRRCENCNKIHVEWFEVSETHAVKVFQKWQQWIIQKPYKQDAQSGEWGLRPEMLVSLSRLCEPVLLPPLAENKQRAPRKSSRPSIHPT